MKTLVINLFGGPGSGKSTGAAYIFSQLKMKGINAELVTEVAKDEVWNGSIQPFKNQIYLFGEQQYRIARCADKVDVIITDSPLLLSLVYIQDQSIKESFTNLVLDVVKGYDNRNYIIERVKPYNPVGRMQTEEESKKIHEEIKKMLYGLHPWVTAKTYKGDQANYDKIVEEALAALNCNLTMKEEQKAIEAKQVNDSNTFCSDLRNFVCCKNCVYKLNTLDSFNKMSDYFLFCTKRNKTVTKWSGCKEGHQKNNLN